MATLSRRTGHPVAEMLDWLETGTPFSLRGLGLAPFVRVEDFVDEGTYVIRAELPGVDPDKDIQLEVTRDTLTIRGERREEQKEKNRREFHYGSFYRSIDLPHGVKAEDIKASYTDGVLEVRIPAAQAEETSRQIPVQRAE
jgi:HSP20 family protein